MAEDVGAEVIALPTAHPANVKRNHREGESDELAVRSAPRRPVRSGSCQHRRTWIDEAARTLTCRDCGVPVDPFSYIAHLASVGESLVEQRARLRFDVRHLLDEKAELERQERNTKARLRNARKRCRALDGDAVAVAIEAEKTMVTGMRAERVERVIEAYVGALSSTMKG